MSIPAFIRSLGNAGAVANSQRAIDERVDAERRVDAMAARLATAIELRRSA